MQHDLEAPRGHGAPQENEAAVGGDVVVGAGDPGPKIVVVGEQRLRTTEASAYTKRDTPTFTCVAASVERALNALDGEPITLSLTS